MSSAPPQSTGDPGVEVRDGRTCARDLLPPGLPIAWSECKTDADCVSQPQGQCVGTFSHECKPASGEGWDPAFERGHACEPVMLQTRTVEPPRCESGECFQLVVAQCVYNRCSLDSDCGGGQRCSCDPNGNRCVHGGCQADTDCAPGERCEPYPNMCYPEIGGYACTTPNDTCEPGETCQTDYGGWCAPFLGDYWECVNHTCP